MPLLNAETIPEEEREIIEEKPRPGFMDAAKSVYDATLDDPVDEDYFNQRSTQEVLEKIGKVLSEIFIGSGTAEAGFKITPKIVKAIPKMGGEAVPVPGSTRAAQGPEFPAEPKMGGEAVPVPGSTRAAQGLEFPAEQTSKRVGRLEKRAGSSAPMPGAPKNPRTVIPSPRPELPDMVIGDITPDDWIVRTEFMLDPDEIRKAAIWYDEVHDEFMKYTNGDRALADDYMMAWLVSQQNVSPEGAMKNVLLQAEQFRRGVPREEMRAGGLEGPTGAARAVLKHEPIESGVGQKISDFVDSALTKSVRSWMGNQDIGGAPFVVDRHTGRDTGLVDDELINHLKRLGYEVEGEGKEKFVRDFGTSFQETQYENRAAFGRELTRHLNDIGWQGRRDWQPREIQAIGWMAMTKLTGGESSGTSSSALEQSLRRISFEVSPGEGSPWAKQYGAQFEALEPEAKELVTQRVTERALDVAQEVSGIDVRSLVHGTGGWNKYQNPSAVGQALASREGAEIAANTLGLLLNQTEVWVNSVKGMTKNPKALAIDLIEIGSRNLEDDAKLAELWDIVQAADPTGLIVGFQPISTVGGDIGIRVLIDKGGKAIQKVEEALKGPIKEALDLLPYKVEGKGYEADLVKARNDWTESPDGKFYLERLADLGVRRSAADWDRLRQELTRALETELGAAGQAPAKGAKASATEGRAKEIGPRISP